MSEAKSRAPVIAPVILSGGAGTRLWPLSRERRPKQMHALVGERSMLATTAARVAGLAGFAPPTVIAAASQADAIEAELPGLDRLILEPCARNTAAAVALAALCAAPDALLLIMPSDHLIRDTESFVAAVRRAAPAAEQGWLVTFGIRPEKPETGYGYIKRGGELAAGIFAAERFVEKPDEATAQTYLEDGRYDWNAGIFLFRAEVLIEALDRHAPDIIESVRRSVERAARDGGRLRPEAQAFAATRSQSIDHAIMEKAERVAVVPVQIGWSDVGSWDALYEAGAPDAQGNVVRGDAVALKSHNSLLASEGPLIVTLGVEDLIVVATGDAVLVARRGDSQRVKEAVDLLKAGQHPTVS